jgi:hypothetical protein
MKYLIITFIIIFNFYSTYCQNDQLKDEQLFKYPKETDNKLLIDINGLKKIFNQDENLPFIIRGVIFNKTMDIENKKETENWLTSYNINQTDLSFTVIDPKNIDVKTEIFSKELKPHTNNYTRSFLLLFIQDTTTIKDYLERNFKTLSLISYKEIETGLIIYFLGCDSYSDFQWKTNQLLYNLDKVPLPEKKEKLLAPKKVSFQLGFSSGGSINKKNTNFDGFSSNQIDLVVKRSFGKNNLINLGGGISFAQNTFSTTSNLLYGEAGSLPLDSIYASLSGVSEKYTHQTINIAFLIALKTERNDKNGFFEFSLSPFLSLQSKLSSTVTAGSITTYGFKNQITDYLYDIPELGLKTQTEEILNVQNYFKTSSYGFNAGVSYNINLGTLIVAPNINFKLISIKNKNSISKAYSIPEDKYNGLFATYERTTPLLLTVGLSISF